MEAPDPLALLPDKWCGRGGVCVWCVLCVALCVRVCSGAEARTRSPAARALLGTRWAALTPDNHFPLALALLCRYVRVAAVVVVLGAAMYVNLTYAGR